VLSTILFLYITRAANATIENENKIKDLLFADDQVLMIKDEKLLHQHINNLRNECSNNNMKINVKKTEVMMIDRNKVLVYL
jgi:hypothetical protein